MTGHINIRKAAGTWVVRAGGAVLGESQDALELSEGSYPEVIYFPKPDIAMAFLDASDTTSECPHRGTASYYSIPTKSAVIKDAAWSYENPREEVGRIRGYIAFFTDKVTVEQI